MSDSSFHLAKFSPLKTPDIGKYRKTRDDDYVSSSSIASSVTNDIIRLSQDVQKKLKSDKKSSVSDSSPEKGSRGNIFLTQRFPEMSNKKLKESKSSKKKSKSSTESHKGDSDAANHSSSSEPSDSDNTGNMSKNQKVKKKIDVDKSAKERKTRKASTSSSESDSSAEMDADTLHKIQEKIRAKTAQSSDSDSSESEVESDGNSDGAKVAETQLKEIDDFVNFSQDLFSQATRLSDSDSERKSKKKSSELQKGKSKAGTVSLVEKMFGPSPSKQHKSKSKTDKANKDVPHKLGKSDKRSIDKQRKGFSHDLSLSESFDSESDISTSKGKATKKGVSKESKITSQPSDSDSDSDNASDTNAITNTKRTVDFSNREDTNSDTDGDNGVTSNISSKKKKSSGSKLKSDSDSENIDVSIEKTSRKTKSDGPKSSTPNKKSKKSKNSDKEKNKATEHSSTTQDLNSPKPSKQQGNARDNMQSPEAQKQAMRQSKITDHCSPAPGSSGKKVSRAKKRQLRYQAPVGFETQDTIDKYVTETEIQGKQLWLIQTPVDFDIQTLHDKAIKLDDAQQIICNNEESEKQFEVVFRPYQNSKEGGYSTVVVNDEGNHKLGERLCGQIQVMDWIPGIPPVTMEIQSPQKHEIPDNLKLRYKPFGAESPKRIENTDLHGKKRKHERGHSERKKKKKKERKTLHDL